MNSPTDPTLASLNARVAPTFAPPELLSDRNWRLISHLGSGSTAQVWLLQHVLENWQVACKVPKSHHDVKVLSQEAELADSLTHENLIASPTHSPQIHIDGATYWEYLPAGSLAKLVANTGKLSLANTVTVLTPMLYVAQYLHAQQIVHGDISPQNILFDLAGKPVLIDLGASRATAHSGTRTGTPGFIAPELARQEPIDGLGAAADVYSLAALGWFCLTGTIPGPPQTRVPLVTLEPALAPEIVELLEAGLAEEPALRPSLDRFANLVPFWTKPEPVDLFATAGEEYELLLPTRKPSHVVSRQRSTRWRRQRKKLRVKKPRSAKLKGSNRVRSAVVTAGVLLVGGVVATATLGSSGGGPESEVETFQDTAETEHVDEPVDFQAEVDALAKARSAAWLATDVSLVRDYAAEGSEIMRDDVNTLETLTAVENTLDGIRMRAVVHNAERQGDTARVTVDWRVGSYTQRDADGEVIEEFPDRVDPIDLRLQETSQGWKIAEVIVD